MKRVVLATAILMVVFLAVSLAQMGAVEANPFMNFGIPHVGIVSPQQYKTNNYQTIYQTATIPIQIQINTPLDYPKIIKVYYILDLNYSLSDNPQKTLTLSSPQTSTYQGGGSTLYWATGTLKNLSNGTHTLDVYVEAVEGGTKSGTRNFLVNTTSTYSIANSEEPSNFEIALVIVITAIIGTVAAVILLNRRRITSQRIEGGRFER